MSLKADDYDPSETLERLRWQLRDALGSPLWRIAGLELDDFLEHEVREALREAFSKAEAIYVHERFKQADQSSRTLLEGILAGAELARRKR